MLELFYLKLLSPIDLRPRLHLVKNDISNKRDFTNTNTNSKDYETKYSVRDYGVFFVEDND